jgi:hypothetical protein
MFCVMAVATLLFSFASLGSTRIVVACLRRYASLAA